jgi:uncharacterized membrane protein YbhN (UPF0104 family)
MQAGWRKWWPVLKALLAVAILVAVGRQFVRDLGSLDLAERPLRPAWLILAGALYVAGIGLSAYYWVRLLRGLGQDPSPLAATRAYYLGHLGKYLPGKAWAVLIRVTQSAGPGLRLGVAVMTTFYEVLATMAAACLLAAVLFAVQTPDFLAPFDLGDLTRFWRRDAREQTEVDPRLGVVLSLLLLGATGLPLLPPVFNRLVHRLTKRFKGAEAEPLPPMRYAHLTEGLLWPALGWLLLGASLWATLQAVLQEPRAWEWAAWLRYSAALSLAYVAGFVLFVPGGLGVREYCLAVFLAPEIARLGDSETAGLAALVVLLLRLLWTAAELVAAGVLWWLPGPAAVGGSL